MGSVRKRGAQWRAEVRRRGIYESKEFTTKAAAAAWVTHREADILAGGTAPGRQTLRAALKRYGEEVSPTHRGFRWELVRLRLLARELGVAADVPIAKVRSQDIATWRDSRLRSVSPGSVNREWNLLRAVFTVATREWGWTASNPMRSVQRPKNPPPRNRRVTDEEIRAICLACEVSPLSSLPLSPNLGEEGTGKVGKVGNPGFPGFPGEIPGDLNSQKVNELEENGGFKPEIPGDLTGKVPGCRESALQDILGPRNSTQQAAELSEFSPLSAAQRVALAFLLAIETGMRAGEIRGLSAQTVNLERGIASVDGKTGRRDVPLSSAARALLRRLWRPEGTFLSMSAATMDQTWRRLRDRAGIEGLHFHDSRAEAATRLSRKLDPLTLARVLGHKDLDMLVRVYYRESIEDIAGRLG